MTIIWPDVVSIALGVFAAVVYWALVLVVGRWVWSDLRMRWGLNVANIRRRRQTGSTVFERRPGLQAGHVDTAPQGACQPCDPDDWSQDDYRRMLELLRGNDPMIAMIRRMESSRDTMYWARFLAGEVELDDVARNEIRRAAGVPIRWTMRTALDQVREWSETESHPEPDEPAFVREFRKAMSHPEPDEPVPPPDPPPAADRPWRPRLSTSIREQIEAIGQDPESLLWIGLECLRTGRPPDVRRRG